MMRKNQSVLLTDILLTPTIASYLVHVYVGHTWKGGGPRSGLTLKFNLAVDFNMRAANVDLPNARTIGSKRSAIYPIFADRLRVMATYS